LSEIGVFVKVVVKRSKEKHIRELRSAWLANNISKQGLDEVVKKMEEDTRIVSKPQSAKEVKDEWVRLQKFMKGKK
jgi:hypothetical protein